MIRPSFVLAMGLALGSGGCWLGKKKVPMPPVPMPPAPLPASTQPPAPVPPVETNPAPPKPVRKPVKKPVAKPAVKPPAPVVAPVQAAPAPAPPPPVPAPKLSEILTDDRRREYEAAFTASVTRARDLLRQLNGRALNASQKQTVERVETFLRQAADTKSTDLATALQLARRADLLAQDLRKSVP